MSVRQRHEASPPEKGFIVVSCSRSSRRRGFTKMKKIWAILGAMLAIFPNIHYLADLRYRVDPALERSVCRSLVCSDTLLLDAADRLSLGGKEDKALAVANLREALRRNVTSPYRWADLGQAFLSLDQTAEAQYCFMRAVQLGPRVPPILWRTALFYLDIQDLNRSQEYLSKMLEVAPDYKELVFGLYLSSPRGVVDTFEFGIRQQGRMAQDYFRYLLGHAPSEDVDKAWSWLQDHSLTDSSLAADYVDFLLKKTQYELASEIWIRSLGGEDDAYLHPNLVFNGGFEREPVQAGLDWSFSEIKGVNIRRDSAVALSGSSSVQIEFDGARNIDSNLLTQSVVANPGRHHFSAWVRTSELTTDQGIGFRLVDSLAQVDLQTPRLTRIREWTPVDLEFTLSGPPRLLRIEVVYQSSQRLDEKIIGRAWIDDVSLIQR